MSESLFFFCEEVRGKFFVVGGGEGCVGLLVGCCCIFADEMGV